MKISITFLLKLSLVLYLIQVFHGQNWQIGEGGVSWSQACDFTNRDFISAQIPGEQCGQKCISTSGCSHFTWTTYLGGTCWMKYGVVKKSDAFVNNDKSSVCGILPGTFNFFKYFHYNFVKLTNNIEFILFIVGPIYSNVLTTFHGATEVGACSLPANSYSTVYPVALGNIDALGNLKFAPNLCGHILSVNCGNGAVNVIVSNSNLGGGLDLYSSSWNKATNYKPPGQQYCSVQLTSQNIFTFSGYVCYHATGETTNAYYRNVGLFNIQDKLIVSATYNGINGAAQSSSPYFAFNGYGTGNMKVEFRFADGSTYSVALSDCKDGSKKQTWS